MKVVCCKKCGAKYQLEDDDDISTYECTSCTGDLELCDDYSPETSNKFMMSSNNSNIAYCVNCGLKYTIGPSDNILDYECESCGGSLRYLDEELNEDIDKIVAERENQKMRAKIETKVQPKAGNTEKTPQTTTNSKRSLASRFGNFFSEKKLHEIASEESLEREEKRKKDKKAKKTAKTRIPKATRRKFEKEFLVPNTNDYNVLKGYLINEFYKNVSKYYGVQEPEEVPNGTFRQFTDMESYNTLQNKSKLEFKDSIKAETETIKNPKNIAIIFGVIIFAASVAEIVLINTGIGIFTLFVGVILICYGLYRKKDEVEVKKRTKIIRDQLLSLPEEYYVFYDVRVPGSRKGINHLVIGPSGIYEIISKKYTPKSGATIENNTVIEEQEDEEKIEEIITPNNIRTFKYTTKQTKFPQDNKVKQTSLKLGENLINFLNENDIKNCFVEPLVGFVNDNVVVINMPLTDEDLFIDELIHRIKYGSVKLDSETIDKCAVLLSKFAVDCMNES